MSATVIDALIVSLGLDPKAYIKGKDAANKAQTDLEKKTIASVKNIDGAEKKAANEQSRRAKENDARTRSITQGIVKLRNEALTMFAVFTGGVGLIKFAQNTISTAANLGRLSVNLKTSATRLEAWQQAAERAGGSREGIIAQLKESASEVAKFQMGMASDSTQWFFRMGGSPDDLKDGNTYLMARANIVKKIFDVDPGKAASIAQSMGISEDQFNLIKLGAPGIEKLLAAREKYSKFTKSDTEDADKLRIKMLDLKDAFELAGTKLLIKLAPALESVMNWLQKVADWINEHRGDIAKWFGEIVDNIIPVLTAFGKVLRETDWSAVGSGIKIVAQAFVEIAQAINSAYGEWDRWMGRGEKATPGVSKLGGAIRFGKSNDLAEDDIRNGRKSALPRQLSGGMIKGGTADSAVSQLIKLGWSPAVAAGMVGSLIQESGLDPAARNAKSGMYGIGQWSTARRADFKAWSGRDIEGSTLEQQLAFMHYELTQGKEQAAGTQLRGARTAGDAAAIHTNAYERPGAAEANIARRQALAEQLHAQLQQSNATATANLPVGARATAPQAAAGSNVNTSETHIGKIEVHTAATDATGIARDIGPALKQQGIVSQANTGLN